MILASLSSPSRRLAVVAAAALLVAACAVPTNEPTPSPTPAPTLAPSAPPYVLAPSPSGCPASTPFRLPPGATNTITVTTNFGEIVIKVDATLGPNAAGAFTALARCGYYNNVLFHRIVPDFMIQFGDGEYARLPSITPEKMGYGGPGWSVPDDPVTREYTRGMVAMARSSAADSGGSQFFIVLDDSAQAALGADSYNNYAQIGYVISGMDVVDRIAQIPTGGDNDDMALEPAVILGTTVSVP
jgi:cyclophilin family peptidyl-prolyl cis-trans isomerase